MLPHESGHNLSLAVCHCVRSSAGAVQTGEAPHGGSGESGWEAGVLSKWERPCGNSWGDGWEGWDVLSKRERPSW